MEVTPTVLVTRFAQLAPGDLCMCNQSGTSFIAVKAVDPAKDGDKYIVALGPSFPPSTHGPHLIVEPSQTVISFGKNYVLQLPTSADCWLLDQPARDVPCILVTEDVTYFRANSARRSGQFSPCFVRTDNGQIQYGGISQIAAYAIRWEILVKDTTLPRRVILQHGFPTPTSTA